MVAHCSAGGGECERGGFAGVVWVCECGGVGGEAVVVGGCAACCALYAQALEELLLVREVVFRLGVCDVGV